jgi:hypothetical protein
LPKQTWQSLANDISGLSDDELRNTWRRRFLRPLKTAEARGHVLKGTAEVLEGTAKDEDWDMLRDELAESLKEARQKGAPGPAMSTLADQSPLMSTTDVDGTPADALVTIARSTRALVAACLVILMFLLVLNLRASSRANRPASGGTQPFGAGSQFGAKPFGQFGKF